MASYNTRWSFSGLQNFENCQYKYYRSNVLKDVVEVYADNRKNGIDFHKAAEVYMKSDGELLDISYFEYRATLEFILSMARRSAIKEFETDYAVDSEWNKTSFNYRSKSMWVGATPDVLLVNNNKGVIIDYKLGKPRSDTDQLKLYAGVVSAHYPEVTAFSLTYLYLAHSKNVTTTITTDELSRVKRDFKDRVVRIYNAHEADKWKKEPNPLCGWCPVTDCEHNKRDEV